MHGGDRLPWVSDGASDNHAPLNALAWQVHVYGSAGEPLRAGVRETAYRCTCSRGAPLTRRRGWPAMRSTCCGPTLTWRSPTAGADAALLERYAADRQLRF